jgi:hypothetical protein
LCDLEGKTGREVARQLKIPEGTLASRLRTGRTILAKRLARHGLVVSGGALATMLSQYGVGAAPPAVVSMTIKTATLVATGKTAAAGAVSVKVAALTEGVMKAMFLAKLKAMMAVLVLVGGLGGTAGLTYQMEAAAQPGPQRAIEKPQPQPVADAKQREKEKLEQADEKLQKERAGYFQAKGRFEESRADLAVAKERLEQALMAMTLAKNRFDLIQSGINANAQHITPNFIVLAPTEDIARTIGEQAEAERKRLAKPWLGMELPAWQRACLVHVTLVQGKKAEGFVASEFEEKRRFAPIRQQMSLKGRNAEAILRDVLPQQVMHALLAHELGVANPRWIEQGAGLMAQSEEARNERLAILPKAVADGKTMRLAKSFELRDFPGPGELETWYAQSLSVCEFLVARKDRATLLAFVARGMERGWDDAVRRFYGFNDVDDLQAAWRKSVLDTGKKAPESQKSGDNKALFNPKERAIEYRLKLPISFNLKAVPLSQAIRDLSLISGVMIVPDLASFAANRIDLDTPVTLAADNISMESALNLLLKNLRLTYVIENQALQITAGQLMATIRGEVLKVHVAELSVSILVEADKKIVYLTSGEDKKGDATYRINGKTIVLNYGNKVRMKLAEVKLGDRITIELDTVTGIVGQIVVERTIVVDSTWFNLPIRIGPSGNDEIESIDVYISSDEGAHWELKHRNVSPAAAEKGGLNVIVPKDGVYWYAFQTRTSTGVVTPTDRELRPNLKVRVDTTQSQKGSMIVPSEPRP